MVTTAPSGAGVTRPARPAARAHRVIFIDLARALAVLLMVQGHTFDALLDPAHRRGLGYDAWVFQRGLTSCLFLLLAGFAFTLTTTRHWDRHLRLSRTLGTRLRRFGLFVVLGYGLHFPVRHYTDLVGMADERWQSFLAVDVLQLIGLSLIGLQFLVLVARTPRAFAATALASCVVVVVSTPLAHSIDWSSRMPSFLGAYLTPATGSNFPLLPWSAYVLFGAALGHVYSRWGALHLAAFANRVLLIGGAGMLTASLAMSRLPFDIFEPANALTAIPNQFLVRVGSVLLLLGIVAHLSRRIATLPWAFAALAQESLLVYFVHLCIVYGSIWNPGLLWFLGATLAPGQILAIEVVLIGAMVTLALGWNWCKHSHAKAAHVTAYVVLTLLALILI